MALYCLAWIRDLVDRFIGKEDAPFPDDVITEILVRLPAKDILKCRKLYRHWDSLTSAPHFIQLHLQRATPMLFVQYYVCGVHRPREFIYLEDDSEKKKKGNYFSEIHSKSLQKLSPYWPWLLGSRDGLLLFDEAKDKQVTKFFVINPVIEEHVSVIPLLRPGKPCSIFFHPPTKDYIVLYYHQHCNEYHNAHLGYCYRYFAYALWAKKWKEITCFSYRPTTSAISTVLVNGCLHWITKQDFKDASSDFPPCRNAIMVYSIDTEEFHAMPHPGPKCKSTESHQWMYLFEMEKEVAFFHVCYMTTGAVIYIWVLEDYGNWGWANRYKVDLGWMKVQYTYLPDFYNHTPNRIKLLNILNDELLFDWTSKGVFSYNLKRKKFWKITTMTGIHWWRERYGMAVTYTESLIRPSLSS